EARGQVDQPVGGGQGVDGARGGLQVAEDAGDVGGDGGWRRVGGNDAVGLGEDAGVGVGGGLAELAEVGPGAGGLALAGLEGAGAGVDGEDVVGGGGGAGGAEDLAAGVGIEVGGA